MNNNPEIINRLMNALGYKTKRVLAQELGISASDLNNRTKSGTIKTLLIDLAVHNNVNVNWLLTGKGSVFINPDLEPSNLIRDTVAPYLPSLSNPSDNNSPDIQVGLRYAVKAFEILISGTGYAKALKENITWFKNAVENDKRMLRMEDELMSLKKRLSESGIL